MRHPRDAKPHLHAAQRADKLQVTEIAQMADAEDAVLEDAEPVPETHVEPLEDDGPERIRAMPLRNAYGRE